MPAETHQRGSGVDPDEVLTLLSAMLDDGSGDVPDDATLASMGVDAAALEDLWDAVRGELGERSLGPADGSEELDCSMTVGAAAAAMCRLLSTAPAVDRDR